MPIIRTAMGRRLVRWMLSHEQPAPLAIEHPVQEDLSAATDEIERMHAALVEIRDHWANQYDHPRKQGPMYHGSYGIGVTDGHRAAAIIASKGLGEPTE